MSCVLDVPVEPNPVADQQVEGMFPVPLVASLPILCSIHHPQMIPLAASVLGRILLAHVRESIVVQMLGMQVLCAQQPYAQAHESHEREIAYGQLAFDHHSRHEKLAVEHCTTLTNLSTNKQIPSSSISRQMRVII